MCLCMAVSCQEKSGEDKLPEEPGAIYSVSGNVQKGPFAQGTAITIQALDESLNPTGQNYSTTTYDDFGAFSIGSQIESRYVEIVANGYYYNEVAGSLSKSQITLRSISDLSEEGNTNINLLTTLESDRIRWLVTNEDMEVADARRQAEQEIYDVFHIPLEVGDSGFDKADISKAGDGNAVLLAISATLQGSRTEAELSELIAKISSELQNTGTLGKSDLAEQIRVGGMGLDYKQIASNLESRYSQLGLSGYVIPPFEDFLDINGNGVIDRDDQWLLVSDAQYSVPQGGGEYSLTVEYNVDYDVMVQEGCDWISVSSGADTKAYLEIGDYTVAVEPNNTFASRTAGITFKARESSQEVTVYVEQEAAVFSIETTDYYVDNSAQTIEVLVMSTSSDYRMEIVEGKEWLEFSEASDGRYLFSVAASDNYQEDRTGRIEFRDLRDSVLAEVTVCQGTAEMHLSQTEFYLDNSGQQFTLEIYSNTQEYTVSVAGGIEWLELLENEGGLYTFSVTANNDFQSDRNGRIVICDNQENILAEAAVIQARAEMSVAQESVALDNAAQSFILSVVSSTEDYDVSVTEGSDWLAITSHKGGEWTFSTYENNSYQPREGMIKVSDVNGVMLDTISVTQWCETVTQVNVTPGNLESLITLPGQLEYTETFIATGEMNEYDFLFIREMKRLKNIDISGIINTTLPKSVFQKMYSLERLVLPSNLVETPYSMCQGCYNLKEALPLPESVVIIGEETFSGCSSLEGGLILHEGITTIGTGAFNGCSSLTGDLVIPSTVTFMGGYGYIFPGCEKIEKVYMKPAVPPQTYEGYDMFPNYNYLGVPVGSKNLYEADDHYNKFMVIEEVDFDALGL